MASGVLVLNFIDGSLPFVFACDVELHNVGQVLLQALDILSLSPSHSPRNLDPDAPNTSANGD